MSRSKARIMKASRSEKRRRRSFARGRGFAAFCLIASSSARSFCMRSKRAAPSNSVSSTEEAPAAPAVDVRGKARDRAGATLCGSTLMYSHVPPDAAPPAAAVTLLSWKNSFSGLPEGRTNFFGAGRHCHMADLNAGSLRRHAFVRSATLAAEEEGAQDVESDGGGPFGGGGGGRSGRETRFRT